MDAVKEMAESGTGIRERVINGGPLWDNKGNQISDTKASQLFRQGEEIAAPNAGAGSYKTILKRLGFAKVDVLNWSSSAGDWQFSVRGGYVCQENRWPYCGFKYSFTKASKDEINAMMGW